jgi:hypothetical protein
VDDADGAGSDGFVEDVVIAEVSDDVGHAVERTVWGLSVDDRNGSSRALEPLHDGTADETATTRDQYPTTDP